MPLVCGIKFPSQPLFAGEWLHCQIFVDNRAELVSSTYSGTRASSVSNFDVVDQPQKLLLGFAQVCSQVSFNDALVDAGPFIRQQNRINPSVSGVGPGGVVGIDDTRRSKEQKRRADRKDTLQQQTVGAVDLIGRSDSAIEQKASPTEQHRTSTEQRDSTSNSKNGSGSPIEPLNGLVEPIDRANVQNESTRQFSIWSSLGSAFSSIGSAFGSTETSQIPATLRANSQLPSNSLSIWITTPRLLFTEIKLEIGEQKTWPFRLRLPSDLPCSHRGKLFRTEHEVQVGLHILQKNGEILVKKLLFPVRIFQFTASDGSSPQFKLGYCVVRDQPSDLTPSEVDISDIELYISARGQRANEQDFNEYVKQIMSDLTEPRIDLSGYSMGFAIQDSVKSILPDARSSSKISNGLSNASSTGSPIGQMNCSKPRRLSSIRPRRKSSLDFRSTDLQNVLAIESFITSGMLPLHLAQSDKLDDLQLFRMARPSIYSISTGNEMICKIRLQTSLYKLGEVISVRIEELSDRAAQIDSVLCSVESGPHVLEEQSSSDSATVIDSTGTSESSAVMIHDQSSRQLHSVVERSLQLLIPTSASPSFLMDMFRHEWHIRFVLHLETSSKTDLGDYDDDTTQSNKIELNNSRLNYKGCFDEKSQSNAEQDGQSNRPHASRRASGAGRASSIDCKVPLHVLPYTQNGLGTVIENKRSNISSDAADGIHTSASIEKLVAL